MWIFYVFGVCICAWQLFLPVIASGSGCNVTWQYCKWSTLWQRTFSLFSLGYILLILSLSIPHSCYPIQHIPPSSPAVFFPHCFLFYLLSPILSYHLCSSYPTSSSSHCTLSHLLMLSYRNSQIPHMLISGSSYFTNLINFHEGEVAIMWAFLKLEGVGCVLRWIIDGVSLPLSLMKAGSCSSCWNTTIGREESRLEKEEAFILCMEG